jgi:hypothetical protein
MVGAAQAVLLRGKSMLVTGWATTAAKIRQTRSKDPTVPERLRG